ncbi:MAG: HD domain-containing protein, partial [candidate division WOR-3 bacterium]
KDSTIDTLMSFVKQRDTRLYNHLIQTAKIAFVITTEMELPEDEKELLLNVSLLHDLGKVFDPLGNKTLQHTRKILSLFGNLFSEELSIIEAYHNNFFQGGGENLSLLLKLLSIADVLSVKEPIALKKKYLNDKKKYIGHELTNIAVSIVEKYLH